MNKKYLLTAISAALLSTGMITTNLSPAFAASESTGAPAPATAQVRNERQDKQAQTAERDLFKVSDDALLSMRDMHSARLAIFNGDTAQARTYVDAAVTRIDAAIKDADKYALDIKAPKAEDTYIPFNASLTVLDTLEPNDAKAKHIAKANEHLHRGEQKQALETLKLGEVDVAVTTELLPVKFARTQIAQAASLIGAGKYYEANLALKAVDDAALVQTYAVDATPKAKHDSAPSAQE